MSYPSITAAELFKLSMYIGQYKAPVPSNTSISINTTLTNSGAVDVYALLPGDGSSGVGQDSGGVTATNGTHGTSSVNVTNPTTTSIQYNIQYTRTDSFVGQDSITYKIINPAAPSPASNTITVNLIGITSNAAASGATSQAFTYNIATNGSTSGANPYSISAGSLPSFLTLNTSSGAITGTPTNTDAGTYSFTVGANTTVGVVTKAVTVTIDGITSASTATGLQNSAFAGYQITSVLSPTGYGLSGTLPTGLTFDATTGQITGTPTLSGSFPLTMSATTVSGTQQRALTLNITSAGAPVITTNPAIAVATPPTVIGTVGTAITGFQINATNPPITANSYSATGVSGISANPATGVVSGTPTTSGDFTLVFSASNGATGSLSVNVRINANAAPVISSAATGSAAVGTATANAYQITTSANGPITSYSVVSGTPPAGLTLNATTGIFSGTPTSSGVFTVTLGATNSAGLTGSKVVTFTVSPNAAPAITSPANGSTTALGLGTAMAPIQLVATNPVITSYAVTPALPTGVSLDSTTGIISGTPTTPQASVAYAFTATNTVGTSASITLNFSVNAPSAAPCTISTPFNTATTIDLKTCLFPTSTITGFAIPLAPVHGTLTVNGNSATYTPQTGYFGTDMFMATAYLSGGLTASGQVSVSVTGRPDPSKDATIIALVTAQNEAARRFSSTQLSNFVRRLEGLHGMGAFVVGTGPQPTTFSGPAGAPASGNNLTSAAASPPPPTQLPVGNAPASLPVGNAVSIAASQLGLSSSPLYTVATGLVQNRSVDLGALNAAFSGDKVSESALPSTKIWMEGVASFGSRDASGAISSADFTSSGITLGMDRKLNDTTIVGMGVGVAKDTTYIGTDGSRNEAKGYSLAVYGSYQPGGNAFFEGLIGLGTLDFDMQRYVAAANDFAVSNRKGYQWFGSLGAGLEYKNKGTLVSPYARLDFSSDRLNEATETGAGAFALTYFEQSTSAAQGVLGLRGEAIHATPFGWAVPRARVEWRQDLLNGSDAYISYADQVGGTRYAIAPSGSQKSALLLGLGSEFIFRDGWSFGVDYQLSRVSAQESSYAIRLKLSKELGVRGLPKLLQGVESDFEDDDEITVDSGVTWDDNITRAKLGSDIRADNFYTLNVSKTHTMNLTGNTRLLLTGIAGAERFQNFNGLSHIGLTGEAVYQYRASSEFDAPTFGLVGRIAGDDFQTTLRDGMRYAAGVSVQQPLTDRITVFGALMQNIRRANSAVFSTEDTSLRMNLDYALRGGATLYFTGEYRDGDIVSTGRASLENVTIAKVFVQDDAYPGGQFFSYQFKGNTLLTTIGYNLGLGARDSLDISWRRVESTPSLRPVWAISPSSYITNQVSASYLMRF